MAINNKGRLPLLYVFVSLLGITACTAKLRNHGEMNTRFESLHSFNRSASSTHDSSVVLREEFYLVSDAYCTDMLLDVIDSFACQKYPELDTAYRGQHVYFLRKSEVTNTEYLKQHPRDLDRYSLRHDLICSYAWSRGKFLFKSVDLCAIGDEPEMTRSPPCPKWD